MTSNCSIELFETPLDATYDDLKSDTLDIIFSCFIVNPYGPTLTFVATLGAPTIGHSLPLLHVMLNPFSQKIIQVGRFHVGETWNASAIISKLRHLPYGSCPTLVLINHRISIQARHDVVSMVFRLFDKKIIYTASLVNNNFGAPFDRVSRSMFDVTPPSPLTLTEAVEVLSHASANGNHVFPELGAFLYAWQGSIEQTDISQTMRDSALSLASFREFFESRFLATVWLPPAPDDETKAPIEATPERLRINSLKELDQILDSEDWRSFEENKLADLVRAFFLCYGTAADTDFVPKLAMVYSHFIKRSTDIASRQIIADELVRLVNRGKLQPAVFFPLIVLESAQEIVSKATIDFISCSSVINGELYALSELRTLFTQDSLENRGAAFGAMIAMGDPTVISFANQFKSQLTVDEVRVAARTHTQFPQHHAIRYWLDWGKELVNNESADDQGRFGACASSLILVLRHKGVDTVSDGYRNFPCHKTDTPVSIVRSWTLESYAAEIAGDLYLLERLERSPKLFSDVLREWGLAPHAPLLEQYIHDSEREPTLRALRDVFRTPSSTRNIVSKIFNIDDESSS